MVSIHYHQIVPPLVKTLYQDQSVASSYIYQQSIYNEYITNKYIVTIILLIDIMNISSPEVASFIWQEKSIIWQKLSNTFHPIIDTWKKPVHQINSRSRMITIWSFFAVLKVSISMIRVFFIWYWFIMAKFYRHYWKYFIMFNQFHQCISPKTAYTTNIPPINIPWRSFF